MQKKIIPIMSKYFLHISMVLTFVIAQDQTTMTIPTIVVTASGFSQSVRSAPASVSVISQAQLQTKAIENLGDAVKNLQGIQVDQGGKAGGAEISIRGLPSSYTLILIDGKRLNQNKSGARPNGFGDVDTHFMPPISAIERIEVVRGPMSTLYGSDALGGVINIITKKRPSIWGGNVNLYHTLALDSRFGAQTGINAYAAGPVIQDLFSMALMGNYQYQQNASGRYAATYDDLNAGIRSGKIANFSGLGRNDRTNIGTELSFTPNADHTFTLNATHAALFFDNSDEQVGTLNRSIVEGKQGGGYDDALEFRRSQFSMAHHGNYAFAQSDTSIQYDTSKTIGRLNPIHYPIRLTDGTPREIRYRTTVVDHKWMIDLSDHFLSIGGQYNLQRLTDRLEEAPLHVSQWQWAIFAEDEWQINEALTTTLGIRLDNNQRFGYHLSPRFYLVWDINREWQIKGGFGQAFKAPEINLMSDGVIGLGGQGTIPLLGNANLKPETSNSSELSLSYEREGQWSITSTGFYTRFNDKIESVAVPNCRVSVVKGCLELGEWNRNGRPVPNFFQRMNVDHATIYGFEMAFNYALRDDLKWTSNYTFTDSQYDNEDGISLPLSSTARHIVNTRLDWALNERLGLWLQAEYRAKQFNALNWNQEKIYFKSYGLMNVGAHYQLGKAFVLNMAVNNIFNHDFIDYAPTLVGSKQPTLDTAFENRYKNTLAGRRLWVSLKYDF